MKFTNPQQQHWNDKSSERQGEGSVVEERDAEDGGMKEKCQTNKERNEVS